MATGYDGLLAVTMEYYLPMYEEALFWPYGKPTTLKRAGAMAVRDMFASLEPWRTGRRLKAHWRRAKTLRIVHIEDYHSGEDCYG